MRLLTLPLFMILIIPLIAAQPGIGLATPLVETLTIDSFPFTYQNKFRVYNTGEEERVFVISISAPYQDVLDWVTVDASVFTLIPGDTKVVQFSIYADSGYQGEYDVLFKPTLLPTQTTPTPDSAMAHLAMSAAYKLTLIVPEGVGPPRPPEEEIPPEKPRELTKTVEEMEETKASTVRTFDKPLLINVPSRAYAYEPVHLSVEFMEGEEPTELGFILVAPSGKNYTLESDSVFSFNEKGTWNVLIVIKDEIIAGNPLEVEYDFGKDLKFRILPQYGIIVVGVFVVIGIGLYLWRRRK
ncbi:MAG: hypothetical protein AYK19_14840 [Theionarchaea archaeon DG-70-1]|nr:MAG: hypothetical protein AYK19_14840 [Theionarchaea archaeon DG-70-1]